jgi:hypothetical protein
MVGTMRYVLNIRHGEGLETGAVETLADLQSAREEAMVTARRIVEHMRPSRHELDRMAFEITDCAGRLLLTVPFSEAIGGKAPAKRRWWRSH